jgi:hypothetical protein
MFAFRIEPQAKRVTITVADRPLSLPGRERSEL